MDPVEGEDTTGCGNTLSTDELESWTLLDSSPRRSPNPIQIMESPKKKDHPSRVEDEDDEEEEEEEKDEDVSEAESASEEVEEDRDQQEEEQQPKAVSVKESTSRVEVVPEKGPSARDIRQDDAAAAAGQKKSRKHRKKRTDSERSRVEDSSDGISVISESDGTSSDTVARSRDQRKVHLAKGIRLEPAVSASEIGLKEQRTSQLSRKRSVSGDGGSKELVRGDAVVPWRSYGTSMFVLGIFAAMAAAVLIGNSRFRDKRGEGFNFLHEQRISELELENNILKNEMNKLKHLYTRTELDEQVQQADTEWAKFLDEKLAEEQAQTEPEPEPESEPPAEEPLTFRKVPPQDEDVKHKVVWSGDDGQPILIADKDYVLPDFCFNKNAVKDALFSEYSGKYCDIKKRKIEAKQRKAEYARKNHKRYKGEQKDYAEYIIPTKEEIDEYQRHATATPPKPPSLSPFDFDYQKAFETIKEEGAVIMDSLVAILDLDPAPEFLSTPSTSSLNSDQESPSYQADDEASPSPAPSSSSSSSTESVPSSDEIRWGEYPTWVREKYENKPEMHAKLRHKESLLWDWERKKNEFLHQVGLETLEEVDRKSEDELRQRRDEFRSKGRKQQQQQSEEWRKEEQRYQERKYDGRKEEFRRKKYDERKEGKERYDERKEWKDRSRGSGENRSRDHKDHHHNNQRHDSKEHQQPWKNDSDENQRKPENRPQAGSSKEWKNDDSKERRTEGSYQKEYRHDGSRESSGAGKPYHKKHEGGKDSGSGEYRKSHSGERDGKPYYKKEGWKDGSGERRDGKYQKKHSGEHSGEHGRRKDFSGEQKDDHWKKHDDGKREGAKRNGDQWNWSKDHSGEDHSGEGSYLSQYRGEDHHKKKQEDRKFEGKRNFRDDDDDDDDDHRQKQRHSKEENKRKHHHKDEDHWRKQKHHDGDRKWQEHSQERRR